jgi:thiamine biosynthesis protein ThiS
MEIRLNERDVEVEAGATVGEVLSSHGIPQEKTAVEINGEIGGQDVMSRALVEGDVLVVVRFVGGG